MARSIFLAMVLAVFGGSVVHADSDKAPVCAADELQSLVGMPEGLVHAQIPAGSRVIPPDSAVTQDFRPDRTNFDLDKAGVIVRIWCG